MVISDIAVIPECPVCDCNFMHIQDVYTLMGSDTAEAHCYRGTSIGGRTGSRRSAVALLIEGECGHRFELIVQQYKGQLFLETREMNYGKVTPLDLSI